MKWGLIGSSRGFGSSFARWVGEKNESALLVARNQERLNELVNQYPSLRYHVADVFKKEEQDGLLKALKEHRPRRVIYFPGGGPHGKFQSKAWKDHLWAWEVTLLFGARLLHWLLQEEQTQWCEQFLMIGSSVAQAQEDPLASSYASAKHGLLGLYRSVRAEQPPIDIRLFSPPYMNTDLLPQGAWPRERGVPILEPSEIVGALWDWLEQTDKNCDYWEFKL